MTPSDGFAAFYIQEFRRLVLFLIKNGAREADAEEAAQEAMCKALQNWATIDNPRAWTWTVALRIWWKRPGEQLVLDEGMPLPVIENDHVTIEEEKWKVVQLLRSLPPAQRMAAALYYDGFSTQEISDMLGKPAATVRSTLRHARRQLKEAIASSDRH